MDNRWSGQTRMEYLCGQCFARHHSNDVLFGTDRYTSSCDVRQAAHRYAFAGPQAYEDWCRAGKSRVLLDWQQLPASQWQVEQGVIRRVQDANGRWYDRRICPSCHNAVENVRNCLLVGWTGRGMDMPWAAGVVSKAAAGGEWDTLVLVESDNSSALRYARFLCKSKGVGLAVPVGLQQAQGSYAQACTHRCGQNAAAALLELELRESETPLLNGKLDTGAAEDALSGFLEFAGYVGKPLALPTAVLIRGLAPGEDTAQQLRREAVQLFNRLHNCLRKPFLVQWDQSEAAARRVCDWLANQLRPGGPVHQENGGNV